MVNSVHLIGNVGANPEVKKVNDTTVAQFSLATTENWKDKNGDKQSSTQWHNIKCWRGLADVVEKYVKKGDKIYIEGKIEYREYEKDGVKKYFTEITANEMKMLGSPKSGDSGSSAPPPTGSDAPAEDNSDLPF